MKLHAILLVIHRWAGLILAVQVTLWMASGVVMSLLPLDYVRGERMKTYAAPAELDIQNYFPVGGVIADFGGASEATLKTWQGRAVYLVRSDQGAAMYDADSGERITPISEEEARRAALADFAGVDQIKRALYMNAPPHESGRSTPLWQITFDDKDETRIYVSPDTGDVVARRNRVWRFYDFFWMLHIMDYKERDNFNNPLLQIFSVTGMLFAVTGIALIITSMLRGRYSADVRRLSPPQNNKAAG